MSVTEEHPTAEFFLWVAASDRDGHKLFDANPQSAFAVFCRNRDGSRSDPHTSNGSKAADDYHTRAMIIGAREAFERLPPGASVHVLSDQNWFLQIMSEDRALRMARDYLRPNLKSKYQYDEEWRNLDNISERLSLNITADRPKTEAGKNTLSRVKEAASQCARNIHISHGDWDL